ncbi:MAG: gamma-glutamylcyclotransferase family protein [Bacillota bacterium]
MNRDQMFYRCPGAKALGGTYLEGWQLTLPFFANIEAAEGEKTPAAIWEITDKDEKELDKYEGYKNNCYYKTNIETIVNGKHLSVMLYVMTKEYKNSGKVGRSGYVEGILKGYRDFGFDGGEFRPKK